MKIEYRVNPAEIFVEIIIMPCKDTVVVYNISGMQD